MNWSKVWKVFRFLVGFPQKIPISQNKKPLVTVLIPAFNEEKVVGDTIKSIQVQTYPIERIIVIDDSSQDKTAEIAEKLGVEVVRTPCNTGSKAKALNFGANFVNTDIFINVDADTILDPKAIEILIDALNNEETFCASGFVIPQSRRNFWERARLVQYLYYLLIHKTAQIHWDSSLVSSGCFSAIKMSMFKELGGFPIGSIAEDMALTWKAHLEGKKVKFIPQAVCYPKDPANWKQYRSQVTRWYRGFLQCIKDNKTKLNKKLSLAAFVFWYLFTGISYPFFLAIFIYGLISRFWEMGSMFIFLFTGISFEICVVAAAAIIGGLHYHCLKEAILGLPFYWMVGPLDSCLFLKSVVEEWVLGRRLKIWEKGH